MITTEMILAFLTLIPRIQLISPPRDCISARINSEIQVVGLCARMHKVFTDCLQESNGPDFLPSIHPHGITGLLRLEKTLCKPLAQQHIRSFPLDKGNGSSHSSEQVLTVTAPKKGAAARNLG